MQGRLKEALPFFISAVWFSFFLSHNLSIAHDSMAFILDAATGANLWHANHLLTLPTMAMFIKAGSALGVPLSAIELATIPNILCGALAIQMIFLFLRHRLQMSYVDSLLGCFLPAVSFGIWYYSVAIEAYAIPVFLLMLCIYLLADERRTERSFLLVAVIHSLAALYHQFSVLIGPLVLYALYTAPAIPDRRKAVILAEYVAITALLVGGTFVLVAVTARDIGDPAAFLAWLMGNAKADNVSQFVGGFEFKTIVAAFVGFARSLVGGHFAFAVPELNALLAKVFGAQSLDDELFLVSPLSPMTARILLGLALLWGIALLAALIKCLGCLKDIRQTRPIIMILWVLVPMTMMFTFYFGQNVELWLVQSVCFWILVSWALAKQRARRLQRALLAGLLVINVFGTMQFVGSADRDFHQWRLQPVLSEMRAGDMIVIGDRWPTVGFVEYFARVEPLVLSRSFQSGTDVSGVTAIVNDQLAGGGRVFVYDDVYYPDSSSAVSYGSGYLQYLEQFRQGIAEVSPISSDTGRQHRLLTARSQ